MWLTQVSDAVYVFSMGIILTIIGAPLYIVIRLQTDKKFVEKFYDRISFMWDSAFRIWFGRKEEEMILNYLKLKKNSNVLDFGCGSGNTTIAIAEATREGNVIALDISSKQIKNAIKKVKRRNLPNVIFVKGDKKFPKKSFDAVTGVGVLEHLDNQHFYLSQIISSLKKRGKFYFLSFGDTFGIPAPEFFADDKKIKNAFHGLGVNVRIKRERRRFTEYIHIYGSKK